jgi:peptide/nickel transport system substrate-binding protein
VYPHFFVDVMKFVQTGPYKVTAYLRRPDAILISEMSGSPSFVVEKKYFLAKGQKYGTPQGGVMCTGPFKLQSWTQNSIVLSKNPNYWDPDLRAHAKKVTFVWPTNSNTVARGFQAGAFDGGFAIPPDVVDSLRNGAPGKLYVGTGRQTLAFEVIQSTNKGPMASELVRRALSEAIDREGIAKTIWAGLATPVYAPATPGFWRYRPDLFQAAYKQYATGQDLAGAKQLVKEAGPIAKQPIILDTNADNQLQVEEASVIKQNAELVGLNVQIRALPAAQYQQAFFQGHTTENFSAVLSGQYEYVAEPALIYTDAADPASSINLGLNDPSVTAMLQKARGALDESERAKLVIEEQAVIQKLRPWIMVVAPSPVTFVGNRIAGLPTDFTYLMYPWAAKVGAP